MHWIELHQRHSEFQNAFTLRNRVYENVSVFFFIWKKNIHCYCLWNWIRQAVYNSRPSYQTLNDETRFLFIIENSFENWAIMAIIVLWDTIISMEHNLVVKSNKKLFNFNKKKLRRIFYYFHWTIEKKHKPNLLSFLDFMHHH